MKELFMFALLASGFLSSGLDAGCQPMYGAGSKQEPREEARSRYFRGEMSTHDYVDSLIGPMNVQRPYSGKLQKHPYKAFGEGYRYSDSEGNQMKVEPNRFGGWDVYGN